jgi:hypothetical protein
MGKNAFSIGRVPVTAMPPSPDYKGWPEKITAFRAVQFSPVLPSSAPNPIWGLSRLRWAQTANQIAQETWVPVPLWSATGVAREAYLMPGFTKPQPSSKMDSLIAALQASAQAIKGARG